MSVLELSYDYSSLSLKDLIEARDTFHYHLLSKANVIGTAVGRYLIRHDEAWPRRQGEGKSPPAQKSYARTLFNSEVRDYSWPCILAFVREWEPESAFGKGGRYDAAKIVPKTLFLSDGRAVPVCVVQASPSQLAAAENQPTGLTPPAFKLGGGLSIIVNVQGADHEATAGCLVSDGHTVYALTARHACGEPGTLIESRLRGGRVRIGVSSPRQLTRLPFSKVYGDFPGRRAYNALDVGLVRIDTLDDWTSNIYGLPPLGPLADLNEQSLSLRLIDQPVVGVGAAAGLLRGTIKALFYRYRSVGGFDYVGDFLISPGDGVQTRHGDSGMVWHLDVTAEDDDVDPRPLALRDLRPLAVEWGGQTFADGENQATFSIATSLSNICRLLNVELVTDLDRGVSGFWGRTGHYSIAALATGLIGDQRLRSLMTKNLSLLSFDVAEISKKGFDKQVGQLSESGDFVPLADVPDEIWKKLPKARGGREGGRDTHGGVKRSDGPEHPNHYADIDAPFGPDGETWRALCLADDGKISPQAWLDFYKDIGDRATDPDEAAQYHNSLKQGLLPFRIWQYYDALVEFVSKGDIVGFFAAAGTLAHYVGDASQPLHGSVLADGDKTRPVVRHHPQTGKDETVKYGEGVHSAYETAMLSAYAGPLLDEIARQLSADGPGHRLALVDSGRAAARATLEMMDNVARILPPETILKVYEEAGAGARQATLKALYDAIGDETAQVMGEGSRYLAMIWESAWIAGDGGAIAASKIKLLDRDAVRTRYIDPDFVPSVTLDKIGALL